MERLKVGVEKFAYFFFKKRLRRRLHRVYELEDPWSGRELSRLSAPTVRRAMERRSPAAASLPVLDAGGGEGYFYDALKDLVPDYHLLDIEPRALQRAAERLGAGPVKFLNTALDEVRLPPETYGAVWCFSALNYLGAVRYPAIFCSVLDKLWSAVAPGGILILLHPTYQKAETDLFLGWGRKLVEKGGRLADEDIVPLGRQKFVLQSIVI